MSPTATRSVDDGAVRLTVPAGVVSEPAVARVKSLPTGHPQLDGYGADFHINAAWQDGRKRVRITMPLASDDDPLASPMVVHELADGGREILSGDRLKVDRAAHTVSFETTTLSRFYSVNALTSWRLFSGGTAMRGEKLAGELFGELVGLRGPQPTCDPDITVNFRVTSEGDAFTRSGLDKQRALPHCVAFRPAGDSLADRGRWTLTNNTGAVLRVGVEGEGSVVNFGAARDLLTDAAFLTLNGASATTVDSGTRESVDSQYPPVVHIPPGGAVVVAVEAGKSAELTARGSPELLQQAFVLRQVGTLLEVIGKRSDAVRFLERLNACGYQVRSSELRTLVSCVKLVATELGGRAGRLVSKAAFAADLFYTSAGTFVHTVAPLAGKLTYSDAGGGGAVGEMTELPADAEVGAIYDSPDGGFLFVYRDRNPETAYIARQPDYGRPATAIKVPDAVMPGDVTFAPDNTAYLVSWTRSDTENRYLLRLDPSDTSLDRLYGWKPAGSYPLEPYDVNYLGGNLYVEATSDCLSWDYCPTGTYRFALDGELLATRHGRGSGRRLHSAPGFLSVFNSNDSSLEFLDLTSLETTSRHHAPYLYDVASGPGGVHGLVSDPTGQARNLGESTCPSRVTRVTPDGKSWERDLRDALGLPATVGARCLVTAVSVLRDGSVLVGGRSNKDGLGTFLVHYTTDGQGTVYPLPDYWGVGTIVADGDGGALVARNVSSRCENIPPDKDYISFHCSRFLVDRFLEGKLERLSTIGSGQYPESVHGYFRAFNDGVLLYDLNRERLDLEGSDPGRYTTERRSLRHSALKRADWRDPS